MECVMRTDHLRRSSRSDIRLDRVLDEFSESTAAESGLRASLGATSSVEQLGSDGTATVGNLIPEAGWR